MKRVFMCILTCLLTFSCSERESLNVALRIENADTTTEHFNSNEDAARWIADSCFPLWQQARADGKSANFDIAVSGIDLNGTVRSPTYRFQGRDPSFMQLVQIDEGQEPSPKIEGEGIGWDSVKRYLQEEIMMRRVLRGL